MERFDEMVGSDETAPVRVEVESKLLEDAIAEGLARLGISKEDANIEIIDEGKKGGFLGIGGKNAKVVVSRIRRPELMISEIIENLTLLLDESVKVVSVKFNAGRYYCEIDSENIAIVLGRRGKTLDALQILLSNILAKRLGERVRVTLDAAGFREKRKEVLVRIAREASKEAIRSGQRVHLEPMSAHDRKIIHAELANSKDVTTTSEDKGERRHIVISSANKSEGNDENLVISKAPRRRIPTRSASGRRPRTNRQERNDDNNQHSDIQKEPDNSEK